MPEYWHCIVLFSSLAASVAPHGSAESCLQDGLKRVKANIAGRVKKGAMPQKAADAALTKLKGTLSYDDFKSVDLVRFRLCLGPLCASMLPVGTPAIASWRQCMP